MKKIVIMALLAGVGASAAMADPELKLLTNAWFSVSASGSTANPHGCAVSDQFSKLTVADSKLNVAHAFLTEPVVVTASNIATQEISTVTIKADAAILPADDRTAIPSGKIGFALKAVSGHTNFVAWIGGSETVLYPAVTIADGTSYDMICHFVETNSVKSEVMFVAKIGANTYELADSTSKKWLEYGAAITDDRKVAMLGTGATTSIEAEFYDIVVEIQAGEGKIDIAAEDAPAINAAAVNKGKTPSEYLNMNAKEAFQSMSFDDNVKVSHAYALGLVVTDGPSTLVVKNEGKLEIKAKTSEITADKIKLTFVGGVTPNVKSGATITYKLKGSIDNVTWVDLGSIPDFAIPRNQVGDYNYFKIVTNVKLIDEPAK